MPKPIPIREPIRNCRWGCGFSWISHGDRQNFASNSRSGETPTVAMAPAHDYSPATGLRLATKEPHRLPHWVALLIPPCQKMRQVLLRSSIFPISSVSMQGKSAATGSGFLIRSKARLEFRSRNQFQARNGSANFTVGRTTGGVYAS